MYTRRSGGAIRIEPNPRLPKKQDMQDREKQESGKRSKEKETKEHKQDNSLIQRIKSVRTITPQTLTSQADIVQDLRRVQTGRTSLFGNSLVAEAEDIVIDDASDVVGRRRSSGSFVYNR